jgi:hypothetical protein
MGKIRKEDTMKKMMKESEAIKFLLDKGLLFEINRMILNPFGLALAVRADNNGNCKFDGLWDCRDEEEEMVFNDDVLAAGMNKYRKYLTEEGFEKKAKRYDKLNYVYQEKYDQEVVVKNGVEFKEKLFGGGIKSEEDPKEQDIKCETKHSGGNDA